MCLDERPDLVPTSDMRDGRSVAGLTFPLTRLCSDVLVPRVSEKAMDLPYHLSSVQATVPRSPCHPAFCDAI